MRTITVWLLVSLSVSCLLITESRATSSVDFEEVELFGDDDDGFIKTMENILKKVLTTVRGVECTIEEVIEILNATTKYIDDINACGTAIPKDIAKIVKNCNSIISICNDIIHLNSTICSHDEDAKMTSSKCFFELFKAIMKLTRKINSTLKLIAKLPPDTEACFFDATKEVEASYNNFLPNIDKCVDDM